MNVEYEMNVDNNVKIILNYEELKSHFFKCDFDEDELKERVRTFVKKKCNVDVHIVYGSPKWEFDIENCPNALKDALGVATLGAIEGYELELRFRVEFFGG